MSGHRIELRVEKGVKAFGGVHDTLRIVNKKITINKPVLDKKHPKYQEVLDKINKGEASLNVVSQYYEISDEFRKAIKTV